MRSSIIRLMGIPLAVALAAPAIGQSDRSDSNRRSQQDQQRQSQRSRDRDRQDRTQDSSRKKSDSREARTHYRAGLVTGYFLGYADGLDDYILVVGTSRDGQRSQASASRSDGQGLRDRLRQDARRRMSGDRGSDSRRNMARRDGSRQGQQQQRVSGKILATKRVELKNDQQKHRLLLVETRDGKRRIVDAGTKQDLQDLDLQRGDQVTATGKYLRTRDGTPVLNAKRIESQGQSVAVGNQRGSDRQRMQR